MALDPFQSCAQLAAAVRAGTVTPRELVESSLERIARYAELHAVVTVDAEGARRAADVCDAMVAAGARLGPLHGVPITVKDAFAVEGLRSTSGLPELATDVPERDALAVQRLRDAGAVIVGKTNVPPGITGQETANELFGRTVNPWDASRTPGGSSGGAAAALAAGLTAADVGSDSGGSIRQPAHCCGICGHVPTHGLVPLRGHRPQVDEATAGKDIDLMVIGPLARSAADLRLLLDVIMGPDPEVEPGRRIELPDVEFRGWGGLRIAAWLDDPACPTDDAVLDVLEKLAETLRRAGATVDVGARPEFSLEEAWEVAFQLWNASSSERTPPDAIQRLRDQLRTDSFPSEWHRLRAVGETMGHRDWLLLDNRRRELQEVWQHFLAAYDVLLCPVIPVVAPLHDPRPDLVASVDHRLDRTIDVNGRPQPYLSQLTWNIVVGLAGLPSTVVAAGLSDNGLPVGVQIVGRRFGDLTTLRVAEMVESLTGGFRAPPGYD